MFNFIERVANHIATLWSFGDGTSSSQTNPIHNYNITTQTPFTVCLTTMFEDDQGEACCNSICKTVVVDPTTGTEITRCIVIKCMQVDGLEVMPAPREGDPAQQQPSLSDASHLGASKKHNGLVVYPNLNNGNFTISLSDRKGNYEVLVRDKLGREVYKRKHKFNNEPINIFLGNVSSGIYTVEVKRGDEKFAKQTSITK